MQVSQLDRLGGDANAKSEQSSSSRDFTWKTAEIPAVQPFEYTPNRAPFAGVSTSASTYSNPGVPETVAKVMINYGVYVLEWQSGECGVVFVCGG